MFSFSKGIFLLVMYIYTYHFSLIIIFLLSAPSHPPISLLLGTGIAKNKAQAVALYHEAASQGHAYACFFVAKRLNEGDGIAKV